MSDDNDTNKIVFLESTILNLTKKVSELESKLEELIEHLHNENIILYLDMLYLPFSRILLINFKSSGLIRGSPFDSS